MVFEGEVNELGKRIQEEELGGGFGTGKVWAKAVGRARIV
jgi:hypothetical protein